MYKRIKLQVPQEQIVPFRNSILKQLLLNVFTRWSRACSDNRKIYLIRILLNVTDEMEELVLRLSGFNTIEYVATICFDEASIFSPNGRCEFSRQAWCQERVFQNPGKALEPLSSISLMWKIYS